MKAGEEMGVLTLFGRMCVWPLKTAASGRCKVSFSAYLLIHFISDFEHLHFPGHGMGHQKYHKQDRR